MSVILFDDDDPGYLRWLQENPEAFVVNIRRRSDSEYVVLHRAGCTSINHYHGMDTNPGGFTERAYRKICGSSTSEIERFLVSFPEGPYRISVNCSRCTP